MTQSSVNPKSPIQALKKITLSVSAGTWPETANLNSEKETFQMIFGLGTAGLTPFEFLLSKRAEGDCFSIPLTPNELCQTFQHIPLPQFEFPESVESIFFHFQVIKVEDSTSREVIKAMAELSSCGGSCECCGH